MIDRIREITKLTNIKRMMLLEDSKVMMGVNRNDVENPDRDFGKAHTADKTPEPLAEYH